MGKLLCKGRRTSEFRAFVDQVDFELEQAKKELAKCDALTQDLLHFAELKTANAAEGYKVFAMLAEVRKRRRKAKNDIEILTPIQARLHQAGLAQPSVWYELDKKETRHRDYYFREITEDQIRGKKPWTL